MATLAPTRATLADPIHGLLAAFPLALFTSAFAADIAYAESADMQWANFSAWLIAGGVAMGVLAAVAGIVDAVVTRRARRRRNALHSVLTIVMMVLGLVNSFVHSRDAWTSVVPTGLVLSGLTALVAIVTSWMGYAITDRTGPDFRGEIS